MKLQQEEVGLLQFQNKMKYMNGALWEVMVSNSRNYILSQMIAFKLK
jgi:hypothetical protein